MHEKKDTSTSSESKTFNQDKFKENALKGAVIGATSTTTTFALIDRPLVQATKSVAEYSKFQAQSVKWFTQQIVQANYTQVWNNSLYVQAYRGAWMHPFKGYPIALLNSCIKNIVLFPAIYVSEKALDSQLANKEQAKNYSGFMAGLATVYITTPISVIKTRMMTDVPLNNLSVGRFMSGVNAIAMRDAIQYGIYFNTLDYLKEKYGDNCLVAGISGIVGYTFSNPFSVIGLNQKIAAEPVNMATMASKIYKANGVKGFFPLVGLSAFGMFARGIAIRKKSVDPTLDIDDFPNLVANVKKIKNWPENESTKSLKLKFDKVSELYGILAVKNKPSVKIGQFYNQLNEAERVIQAHRDPKWKRYTMIALSILVTGVLPGLGVLAYSAITGNTPKFWQSSGQTFFQSAKKFESTEVNSNPKDIPTNGV